MDEWAIAVFRPEQLDQLDAALRFEPDPASRASGDRREALDAIRGAFGQARWSRLYFGHEFCERRLPTADELDRAYRTAARLGLGFSLLTSYVTDWGLARLRPLLARLASLDNGGIEVIANDWGVVRLVRREFPALRLVLGRLLNRMLRDPRIVPYLATDRAPGRALAALRQSSVAAPIFRRLLATLGVERVEFDNLIQGIDMDFRGTGLAASIYVPYGYIATGRVCMIGSLQLPATEKFDVESPCHRECLTYTLRFRYTNSPFDNQDQEFIERGNTFFYAQDRPHLESALSLSPRHGITRIVYQPDVPM